MRTNGEVRVWDPLVRIGHWALALGFSVAYLTEDDFMTLHSWAGYAVGTVLLARILWGVIGTPHARFSDFVHRPATVKSYLVDILRDRPRRYLGHNPAGGAMVIALLLSVGLAVVSGLALYGGDATAGPLAGPMAGTPGWALEALEETHELFANLSLLLVLVHVGGVVLASLQHGENLVRAMVTGRKAAQTGAGHD